MAKATPFVKPTTPLPPPVRELLPMHDLPGTRTAGTHDMICSVEALDSTEVRDCPAELRETLPSKTGLLESVRVQGSVLISGVSNLRAR